MPSNKPRITILCDEDTYQKVEDFRFDNRYTTRSTAAYDLIKVGLEVAKDQQLFQKMLSMIDTK